MKMTAEDTHEAKLYFRLRGYPTFDDIGNATDLHRTTISKKLTGSQEITIIDIARELLHLIPESKSQIVHLPMPPDDPKLRKPDITRAKTILGWQPMIDRREGLKRMIDFYRDDLKKK